MNISNGSNKIFGLTLGTLLSISALWGCRGEEKPTNYFPCGPDTDTSAISTLTAGSAAPVPSAKVSGESFRVPSPDGSLAAIARGNTVSVQDSQTNQELATLPPSNYQPPNFNFLANNRVTTAAISPTNKLIAIGTKEEWSIWEMRGHPVVLFPIVHFSSSSPIASVNFSPDGSTAKIKSKEGNSFCYPIPPYTRIE